MTDTRMLPPIRHAALGAATWACVAAAAAQAPDAPAAPVDSGAIVVPPDIDRKAVKPAPDNIDPEIAVPAGQKAPAPEPAAKRKRPKQADCEGRPEPCRQSKPK